MQSRIEKSIARYLAITLAPECGEIFKTIRSKRNGWIKMPEWFEQSRKNSGLGDTYVLLYEAEPRINYCLIKSIFLENTSELIKQFDNALSEVNEVKKLTILKNFNDDLPNENINSEIEDVLSQLKEAPEITQEE